MAESIPALIGPVSLFERAERMYVSNEADGDVGNKLVGREPSSWFIDTLRLTDLKPAPEVVSKSDMGIELLRELETRDSVSERDALDAYPPKKLLGMGPDNLFSFKDKDKVDGIVMLEV